MKTKIAILVIIALVCVGVAAGCITPNSKQVPIAYPSVNTSNNTTATATKNATAKASAAPTAYPTATPTARPTAYPTAYPTPYPTQVPVQCTHVQIIIFHPYGTPCNTCAEMTGMLSTYYSGNPYVSVSIQNATSNSVIGVVTETGQGQSFGWGDYTSIEHWTDSKLTCK